MFVSASTHCFADRTFEEACDLFVELEYDKLELWLSNEGPHLKPAEVAKDPEQFFARYRETTRLTAIGFCLAQDVPAATLAGITKAAKMMRVTQITIPATARPRPDSLPPRVLTNVTIPEIRLSGIRLTSPSRNVAIAHLLTGAAASGVGDVMVMATVALGDERVVLAVQTQRIWRRPHWSRTRSMPEPRSGKSVLL